jgi:hypothetical protein
MFQKKDYCTSLKPDFFFFFLVARVVVVLWVRSLALQKLDMPKIKETQSVITKMIKKKKKIFALIT